MCSAQQEAFRILMQKSVCLLLGVSICAGTAQAQLDNTFRVEVDEKHFAHPESDRGFPEGFEVDEQHGKSIAVVRGGTYTFQMDGVPVDHLFYLTTSAVGAGAEAYEDGVTGNFASGDETVTLTVGEETPDTLYYQCQNHEYMGWRIYVVDELSVGLETVAEGLTAPVAMAQPDDGTGRLFVVDQTGQIYLILNDGTTAEEPFLDVSDRMVDLVEAFDERGLLGLAFHPDYATNGRFFIHYSASLRDGAPDGWDNTSTVSEFQVSESDPNRADPASERIVLQVDEPQNNHSGAALLFGPDGYLYLALGDGGGPNDVQMGHVDDWYEQNAGGNGQDVEANLLGSILRIDVDDGDPYGIPADNPFVDGPGLDEIYAYGLRNPYRMSFDVGGEYGLLAGDVGQHQWEEVSRIELGGNYGWNVHEGSHCFSTGRPRDDWPPDCPQQVSGDHPDAGGPLIGPVIEYMNAKEEGGVGHAVVGGVIYRGSAMPELEGTYVFGDWSTDASAPAGALFAATPAETGQWPMQPLNVTGSEDGGLHRFLLGIGQDLEGEMYVLSSERQGPAGTSGSVYRLVAPTNVASEGGHELPIELTLHQNYPNPFNPATTIEFDVPRSANVNVVVFDMLGRKVATLVDRRMAAGSHTVSWGGMSDAGVSLPSGAYIYRVRSGGVTATRMMTLVR